MANVKLPETKENVKILKFSKQERDILISYINLWDLYAKMFRNKEAENMMSLLMALFTRFRQIALDPYLMTLNFNSLVQYLETMDLEITDKEVYNQLGNEYFDPHAEKWKNYDLKKLKHDINFGNAKYIELKKIIEEIKGRGEKGIIFSNSTAYLKLLDKNLETKTTIILSEDPIQNRFAKIQKWRTEKDNNLLLMNYKIGSEGLNLTEANNVILLDTWWNFTYEKQAIARCKRIGQKKEVNVYRLLFENSIEILMFNKSVFKSDIFDKIKNGDDLNNKKNSVNYENMNRIVQALRENLISFELDGIEY